ncbi:helix-turn-helix domain-containing protein [Phytohabitans aurantiacus]|uniref:HTH cro/C1-type domain-containing protein n=1 Tax=Phytohabitans aurantiacus TaxID=3016789 RepID=A0ABQ5QUQ3_9ACTN|nr:helix-turn-helix transcriptional regulator [Phytohabitans aurantiacus]GLH97386.1 hypothetical protein Pa4123_26610 [Phytohabitans aurantiacus]
MSQRKSRAEAFIKINGDALREVRLDRGLSTVQVAARVGVGKAYISKLERGISPRCSAQVHAALVRVLQPADRRAFRADGQKVAA